jgi:hypothetical protein
MAYPTVSGPYGLVPVNAQGGRQYAGSTRMFPILNGYSTSLFNGQVVQLGATAGTPFDIGTVINSTLTYNTASPVAGTIGVFVGCEYSTTGGPIYGKNRSQYWLASTAATDAVAYVVDDPLALFKTCVLNGGAASTSTLQYVNQAYIGSNAFYIPGTGSLTTGNSGAGVAINAAATSTSAIAPHTTTAPFRIVQLVQETAVNVVQAATSSGTGITLSATNSAILPGMAISGPGITNGNNTYVTTVSGTTVTLNRAVTTNQSTAVNFTFTGYPEVIVGWNSSYHGYNNVTGV